MKQPLLLFAATAMECERLLLRLRQEGRVDQSREGEWAGTCGATPWRLVLTGIGPQRAEAAARRVLPRWPADDSGRGFREERFDAFAAERARSQRPIGRVWCVGLCGGLTDDLTIGDVLVASCVGSPGSPPQVDPFGDPTMTAFARRRLVSVSEVVGDPSGKRRLRADTGAEAVDMESAAIAGVARENGLSFTAVRAVSDAVDDALPLEIGSILDPQGRLRMGRLAGLLLIKPWRMAGLLRLRTNSNRALDRLAEVLITALKANAGHESPDSGVA